jgi:hypothetical protein
MKIFKAIFKETKLRLETKNILALHQLIGNIESDRFRDPSSKWRHCALGLLVISEFFGPIVL